MGVVLVGLEGGEGGLESSADLDKGCLELGGDTVGHHFLSVLGVRTIWARRR
jgi:hypothetical protein